jgi:hypothetical protein
LPVVVVVVVVVAVAAVTLAVLATALGAFWAAIQLGPVITAVALILWMTTMISVHPLTMTLAATHLSEFHLVADKLLSLLSLLVERRFLPVLMRAP